MSAAPLPTRPALGARAKPAPIFAVASGKGGVGKTWLSCTLACIYGRLGKRTLLVDGDIGLANVDVQLGVRPQSDLAAGVDPCVMRLARQADRVVCVTTEEPPALTDAYAFMKLHKLQNPDGDPPWIVINMAEKRASGRRVYEQLAKACETYLGFRPPLAGIICRDPRVPDSIRAQTALPVRHPTSAALDEAMRVAEALITG